MSGTVHRPASRSRYGTANWRVNRILVHEAPCADVAALTGREPRPATGETCNAAPAFPYRAGETYPRSERSPCAGSPPSSSVPPRCWSSPAPALAATPADKPVVTVGRLDVHDGGGASPDTWYTKVTVPVGGSNFTPGGDVYVRFQDLTAGTPAVAGEWITAGTGPCGFEGQQLRQDPTTGPSPSPTARSATTGYAHGRGTS